MSYKLSDDRIKAWWKELRSIRSTYDTSTTPNKPVARNVLGYFRIFVQEIPNESCYNYLATCGYECNSNGEILLNRSDFSQYELLFESLN